MTTTSKSPTTIQPASRLGASSPPYTVTTLCCYLYLWMWVVYLQTSSSAYTYVITLVAKAIALGMDCPRLRMRLGLSVSCLAVYSWSSCWLVSGPLDLGEECISGRAINADSSFSYFKSKFHCFDAAIIIAGFIIDVCSHTLPIQRPQLEYKSRSGRISGFVPKIETADFLNAEQTLTPNSVQV